MTVNLSETIKHSFSKRFRGCGCGTIKRSQIVVCSIRDCFIDRTAVGSSDKRSHAAAGSKAEKHVAAHHSGLNCQIDKKFTGSRATGFSALDAHGAFLYEFLTAFDNGIDFVILAAAVFSSLIEKRSLHFIVGGKLFRVHASKAACGRKNAEAGGKRTSIFFQCAADNSRVRVPSCGGKVRLFFFKCLLGSSSRVSVAIRKLSFVDSLCLPVRFSGVLALLLQCRKAVGRRRSGR